METKTRWYLLLTSRKFWAALIGVAFVLIKAWRPDFPISEEQLTSLVVILVGYILGTAVESGLSSPIRGPEAGNPTPSADNKGPTE